MVNIVTSTPKRHNQYLEVVFRIYRDITVYFTQPTINNIQGEYYRLVDSKVVDVLVRFYPDDFYDGSPDKKPGNVLPDHMKNNLAEYVGMPLEITEQIIMEILDDHQMFYIQNGPQHSPLKGVW